MPVKISADPDGATVTFDDGQEMRVTSDWTPGMPLAELVVDGEPLALKIGKITAGFHVRYRGASMDVTLRTPRQAELVAMMPEKVPPDTSKMLLCPMPGLIVHHGLQWRSVAEF